MTLTASKFRQKLKAEDVELTRPANVLIISNYCRKCILETAKLKVPSSLDPFWKRTRYVELGTHDCCSGIWFNYKEYSLIPHVIPYEREVFRVQSNWSLYTKGLPDIVAKKLELEHQTGIASDDETDREKLEFKDKWLYFPTHKAIMQLFKIDIEYRAILYSENVNHIKPDKIKRVEIQRSLGSMLYYQIERVEFYYNSINYIILPHIKLSYQIVAKEIEIRGYHHIQESLDVMRMINKVIDPQLNAESIKLLFYIQSVVRIEIPRKSFKCKAEHTRKNLSVPFLHVNCANKDYYLCITCAEMLVISRNRNSIEDQILTYLQEIFRVLLQSGKLLV